MAVYRPVSIRPFLLGPLIVLILLASVALLLDLTWVVPKKILRRIPIQNLKREMFGNSLSEKESSQETNVVGASRSLTPTKDREDFCAGVYPCGDRGSECDANRRDFILGYEGAPPPTDCPNRLSPQWTYWFFPNVRDRPCTDYQTGSGSGVPPTADTPYTPSTAFENEFLAPAPSDCPYDPQGELYRPMASDSLTIPNPF